MVFADALADLLSPEATAPAGAPPDLSVRQLAERLGRSLSTARGWVEGGLFPGSYRLPGMKRPGAWRVPLSSVQAFTERQRSPSPLQDALGRRITPRPDTNARPRRAEAGEQPDLSAWRRARSKGASSAQEPPRG